VLPILHINNYLKAIGVFFFFFYSSFLVQAQDENAQELPFTNEQSQLVSQLENVLNISLRKDSRTYTRGVDDRIKRGAIPLDRLDTVVAVLNLFHRENLNYNYYETYLDGLFALTDHHSGDELFFNWHTLVLRFTTTIQRRNLKNLEQLLIAGAGFFSEQRIHRGSTTNWYVRNPNFELFWENDQPMFRFPVSDLIAVRREDSTAIFTTRGTFDPIAKIWYGNGGKIEWNTGDESEIVFCTLDTFTLDLTRSTYRIANAELTYPAYFGNQTVLGEVEDRVVFESAEQLRNYPRFYSYESVLEIADKIGPGIVYRGGFILRGTNVEGYGTTVQPAEILFHNNAGELSLKATSRNFSIRQGERLGGTSVNIAIYFDQDSITHPSVNFRYNIPDRLLQVQRGDRGLGKNPFFDSHRKVLVDAENIEWTIGTDSILVGKQHNIPLLTRRNAYFESFDYYDPAVYHSFQSIATTNSLAKIKVHCEKYNIRRMHSDDLAKVIDPRFETEIIVPLLVELMANGFIDYDPETRMVEIYDKVFHYANAFTGKTDFDYLRMQSDSETTNAIINLRDQSMEVNGLTSVLFSKPRQVGLRPLDGKISMFENRNMEFEGLILAGYGELAGSKFRFTYDRNFIEFDSLQTFTINIPTGELDSDGTPFISPLSTRIEDFDGVLMIDAPANKSGKRDIPMFPLLRASTHSKVYYGTDDSTSMYPRSEFFFEIEPFVLEGLDKLTQESVNFPGKLVSGGVFEDIEENLVIMDDQSLGFTFQTPEEGLDIYGGQGTFSNELKLSGSGLGGSGHLALEHTSIDAQDFMFSPKETTASAEVFELEEVRTPGKELPHVLGNNVSLIWRPKSDSLYVRAEDQPFAMFNGEYFMSPEIILSGNRLHGSGSFDWANGKLDAANMYYTAGQVFADTADFHIKAGEEGQFAFSSLNANANLDIDNQMAYFRSNSELASTSMPYVQYITSVNEFQWDMSAGQIDFKSDPGKLASFMSIHPNQDSLEFSGSVAEYSLVNNILSIKGVERIESGDAYIYPEEGLVFIEGDANMKELTNSTIVASRVNEHHIIENANVTVLGKYNFRGSGDYAYEVNGKMQTIHFNDIEARPRGISGQEIVSTHGSGSVLESDEFQIDPGLNFRGTINLDAFSRDLRFDGYARLNAKSLPRLHWFYINSDIDKEDVVINFTRSQTQDQHPVYSGLRVEREQSQLYPLIMNMPYSRRDRVLLDINGTLRYDPEEDAYHTKDSAFIASAGKMGNAMSLYDQLAFIDVSGELTIGRDLPYIEIKNFAQGVFRLDTSTHLFDMFVAIDFIVPDRVWDIMANDITANIMSLPDLQYRRLPHVKPALERIVKDERNLARINDELEFTGRIIYPRRPEERAVFSHIQMEWDPVFQSLVNREKLGIAYLGDKPVNKYINGYFEISEPRNGRDEMTLYIMSPGGATYYFNYSKNGVLRVHSSNSEINDIIENLKRNERFVKMEDGEFYEIIPAQARQVNFFVRRMEAPRDLRDAEMDRMQRELEALEAMEKDGETPPDDFFLEARPANIPLLEDSLQMNNTPDSLQQIQQPGGWLNEGPAIEKPQEEERGGWLNEAPASPKPENPPPGGWLNEGPASIPPPDSSNIKPPGGSGKNESVKENEGGG
jgi:hypothetical protein